MNPTTTPNSSAPVDIARLRELLSERPWATSSFDSQKLEILNEQLRNDAPALLDEVDLHRKKQDEIIALCESERVHHPAVAINRLKAERDKLREEVERLRHQINKPRSCDTDEINELKFERDSLRQQNEQLLEEIEGLKSKIS